jgi:hypothetical protein
MEQSSGPGLAWNRYSEICADIRTTDDISFKILGLVPFVSGAALATILGTHQLREPELFFLGLLGAVLTFGFYRWELRNLETCRWLIARAADIESAYLGLLGAESHPVGQFYHADKAPLLAGWLFQRLHRRGIGPRPIRLGKGGAEHIIYLGTLFAWGLLPFVALIP